MSTSRTFLSRLQWASFLLGWPEKSKGVLSSFSGGQGGGSPGSGETSEDLAYAFQCLSCESILSYNLRAHHHSDSADSAYAAKENQSGRARLPSAIGRAFRHSAIAPASSLW